jgi:hypothetical protein
MTSIQEIRKEILELISSQKETEKLFQETDKKFQETDKFIKGLAIQPGGIGNSNGDHAEEFFYNALESKMKFGGIKYEEISKNLKYRKNRQEDEFDIVLFNGNSIGLIEVKYKVKKEHLKHLMTKKVASFKVMYPEYSNYKFYLGLAGFSFDDKALEKEIESNGVAVLKQKGDHVEFHDKKLMAF